MLNYMNIEIEAVIKTSDKDVSNPERWTRVSLSHYCNMDYNVNSPKVRNFVDFVYQKVNVSLVTLSVFVFVFEFAQLYFA